MQAQESLGGAAAGRPAIEAQQDAEIQELIAQLSPEEAAAMATQMGGPEAALAAGGGAPIREGEA